MRLEDIKRRPHLCDALMKSSHNSVSRLRTGLKAPHAVWRNSFKPALCNNADSTSREHARGRNQGSEKRATLPFAGPNLAASTGCPSNVNDSRPARFPTVILNGASPATCCTLPALTRPENTSLPSFWRTLNQLSLATFNSSWFAPVPTAATADAVTAAPAFTAFANGAVTGALALCGCAAAP